MKRVVTFFRKKRDFSQFLATLISNIHLPNFLKGQIYTGSLKKACIPGLNCYSCPGATSSCPIGSFQAVVGSSKFDFSYYVFGFMMLFGVLFGRLICGFLCPFGWFQDLLYKIKTKKFSSKNLKFLKYLKYLILFVVVWLLGVFRVNDLGVADPYFCKFICPQGILEGGIPLSITSIPIRNTLGKLFTFKFAILIIIAAISVFVYRPFCKFICPLGAFYALFNKVSLYRYGVDYGRCIDCGKCERACDMDIDMSKIQDSPECIRCGKCIDVCPTSAIYTGILIDNKNSMMKGKR